MDLAKYNNKKKPQIFDILVARAKEGFFGTKDHSPKLHCNEKDLRFLWRYNDLS